MAACRTGPSLCAEIPHGRPFDIFAIAVTNQQVTRETSTLESRRYKRREVPCPLLNILVNPCPQLLAGYRVEHVAAALFEEVFALQPVCDMIRTAVYRWT